MTVLKHGYKNLDNIMKQSDFIIGTLLIAACCMTAWSGMVMIFSSSDIWNRVARMCITFSFVLCGITLIILVARIFMEKEE